MELKLVKRDKGNAGVIFLIPFPEKGEVDEEIRKIAEKEMEEVFGVMAEGVCTYLAALLASTEDAEIFSKGVECFMDGLKTAGNNFIPFLEH